MRRVLLGLIAIAAWLAVSVPVPVVTAPRRARLSNDLHLHQQARARHKARVIVHGDRATVRGVAARHGLRVVRELRHEAVLEATRAELDALAAEAGIDHLSGDVPVYSAMGVSDRSTAADQTRAGTSGLLLGLGAIAGVERDLTPAQVKLLLQTGSSYLPEDGLMAGGRQREPVVVAPRVGERPRRSPDLPAAHRLPRVPARRPGVLGRGDDDGEPVRRYGCPVARPARSRCRAPEPVLPEIAQGAPPPAPPREALAQIGRAAAPPAGTSAPPTPPPDSHSAAPDELLAFVSLARVVTADSSFPDVLVGVLTVYADTPAAFTEAQGRMLQMVAPHLARMLTTCRRSAVGVRTPVAARLASASAAPELRIVAGRQAAGL